MLCQSAFLFIYQGNKSKKIRLLLLKSKFPARSKCFQVLFYNS